MRHENNDWVHCFNGLLVVQVVQYSRGDFCLHIARFHGPADALETVLRQKITPRLTYKRSTEVFHSWRSENRTVCLHYFCVLWTLGEIRSSVSHC